MRLDRFFLPRIIIRGVGLIGERIDEAATDKQYIEYKKARRRNDTQGYVISSCEAGNYDYKDYNYYKSRRGEDNYSLIKEESRKGRSIVRKCMEIMIFIAIYLLVPSVITLKLTGVVDMAVSEEIADGRTVTVNYKNASQSVEVEKFVSMVLADRLYMGDEVELLKAESIMIRTDVYRLMGEQMIIDSSELGMEYMTTQQMKSKWGKDYEDNYNLVKDCTAATSGLAIRYNDKYIEARYTYITSGSTLSGASILGDEYAYLSAVECNNDKNAQDYLVVKTISNKDFVNSFEKKYDSINLDKNNLAQQIQIVSKNEAGYVLKLQIGNVVMSGSEFAYVLGINSPNFSIEYMQTGVKITTIGVGEGFGVSVYTADCMAKAGSSYEDIIETFYNKINIISE